MDEVDNGVGYLFVNLEGLLYVEESKSLNSCLPAAKIYYTSWICCGSSLEQMYDQGVRVLVLHRQL